MQRKRWSELSPTTRRLILVLGSIQVSLLAAALVDIVRRPQEQIRGNKWLWAGVSFISFVGPIAYFLFGRERRTGQVA
ncbi:MAG: PLD nuclease N-terminal domain-containing protein [Oscillochloridaceae bacterium]|nr:PLD nuclease N-terminal domain-containing protein [Chloroflexaceae bacterium]MDW8390488.1 PLD nuclease N-terminal domain-containing protein [Oscillochloridaceae bacterium]